MTYNTLISCDGFIGNVNILLNKNEGVKMIEKKYMVAYNFNKDKKTFNVVPENLIVNEGDEIYIISAAKKGLLGKTHMMCSFEDFEKNCKKSSPFIDKNPKVSNFENGNLYNIGTIHSLIKVTGSYKYKIKIRSHNDVQYMLVKYDTDPTITVGGGTL